MKASSVSAHRRCFLISGTGKALTAYSQAVLGLLTAMNSKLILVRAKSAIIQGVKNYVQKKPISSYTNGIAHKEGQHHEKASFLPFDRFVSILVCL
jgi:predicted nucleic-acid-binding protein